MLTIERDEIIKKYGALWGSLSLKLQATGKLSKLERGFYLLFDDFTRKDNQMEGLIEGRIVHFVMPSKEHRPAIVVRVWGFKEGYVNLVVFVDGLNDVKRSENDPNKNEVITTLWETSVEYSENKEPRTWHWIERA